VSLDALIERSDLDGLVIAVDRLCADVDWDGLVALEQRCRAALDRGRQLWPVASHIQYRLALEAPAPFAARVLQPGAGRFALGPLPEVAAMRHRWDSLAPFVPPTAGPLRAICAHERVVRGEDLSAVDGIDATVLETPLRLEPWEGTYPVAEYHPHRAEFPFPTLPAPCVPVASPHLDDVRPFEETEGRRALLDLAAAWTTESDGRAEAVAVRGSAVSALGALGVRHGRLAELEPVSAMALMAWTAASGGAHGRRRGMAAGRFAAWWTVAALGGLSAEWPLPPGVVGETAAELRWYLWDAGEPDTGWACRLAIEDPAEDLAWALAATDSA
jgi:hypothetical protein